MDTANATGTKATAGGRRVSLIVCLVATGEGLPAREVNAHAVATRTAAGWAVAWPDEVLAPAALAADSAALWPLLDRLAGNH